MASPSYTQDLLDKILTLPDDKIAEVADFIEFLKLKTDEQQLTRATTALSEHAFAKVWDNDADAEYESAQKTG
jgi:hypothetical protein